MIELVATIELPWPDKRLSKNARGQWSRVFQRGRARLVAAQRREAWALSWQARLKDLAGRDGYKLRFTFHPPNNLKRDVHNVPAMLAGAIDGIADCLGADDSTFECIFPSKFSEVVKGGKIVVEVS